MVRDKLAQRGVFAEITVVGKLSNFGSEQTTLLLTDVHDLTTDEFLCDHLWVYLGEKPQDLSQIYWHDYLICSGVVRKYKRGGGGIDYSIGCPHSFRCIHEVKFRDEKMYYAYTPSDDFFRIQFGSGVLTDKEEYRVVRETVDTLTLVGDFEYRGLSLKYRGVMVRDTKKVYKSLDRLKEVIRKLYF